MSNDEYSQAVARRTQVDDEIDLFDLLDNILAEKYTIIGIFALSIIAAILSILLMTPVYKSTAYVLPPNESDLSEMNKLALMTENSTKFTPQSVFTVFLDKVGSRELKKQLFNQYDLAEIYLPDLSELPDDQKPLAIGRAAAKFNDHFSISLPKKDAGTFEASISLSMKGAEPRIVATILNDLVKHAEEQAVRQIYEIVNSERANRLQLINVRISVLRKSARDKRMDRIAQLDEAIRIARRLEISRPNPMGPALEVQDILNQGLPLYYLGYNLLEAEKETLINRENDDPFIEGFREMQDEANQLMELKFDIKAFRVMKNEQSALPATNPEKPKPKLIIALAGVLGLTVGVFFALVRRAFRNRSLQNG